MLETRNSQQENLCNLNIYWVEHAPTVFSLGNCLIFTLLLGKSCKLRVKVSRCKYALYGGWKSVITHVHNSLKMFLKSVMYVVCSEHGMSRWRKRCKLHIYWWEPAPGAFLVKSTSVCNLVIWQCCKIWANALRWQYVYNGVLKMCNSHSNNSAVKIGWIQYARYFFRTRNVTVTVSMKMGCLLDRTCSKRIFLRKLPDFHNWR